MKGYAKPTTEVLARISALREELKDLRDKIKVEDRNYNAREMKRREKIGQEIHRLQGGE